MFHDNKPALSHPSAHLRPVVKSKFLSDELPDKFMNQLKPSATRDLIHMTSLGRICVVFLGCG